MCIAASSIERPLITWLIILIALFGGVWGFNSLGRLEDPAFTIKQAIIVTQYPGASAEEVAKEVSEPIESEIQKMGEIDRVTSTNRPGYSRVEVEIKSTINSSELPAIWTKLRNRVSNAARQLPAGVSTPFVNDSFGDVYGIYYAITAEGFTDAEKHKLGKFLRRELLTVKGVSDIQIIGLPEEAIFVEPNLVVSVNQRIPPQAITSVISSANSVADGGSIKSNGQETNIQIADGSGTATDISGLTVGASGRVVKISDFAEVKRERIEKQSVIIRFNGKEAFTLGIAGLQTDDIVTIGGRVEKKISELRSKIPSGVKFNPIYKQHQVVDEASNSFLVNLAMSVGIVIAVLALFMGWRAAVVVGVTLLLTVVGTLFFMALFSIEMERISLGALIIAMGMLVDNAIVIAEGMQVAMLAGRTSIQAADEVSNKTQIPLLGATVIGILAFAGIGLSPDSTGEFLFSLFAVIGISLILSWALAVTVTPLLAHYLFVQGSGADAVKYDGFFFRLYGSLLKYSIKLRWFVVMGLAAITVLCFAGFGLVKQQFFPDSNTPLLYVHYKLPNGTTIHQTSDDLKKIEKWLKKREEVVSVSTFVGQGATRFLLTYSPEEPNSSYGHLIIRTENLEKIIKLRKDLEVFGRKALPVGEFRTQQLAFGPGGGASIEVRFSGPDASLLRKLATEAIARMSASSKDLKDIRINWRERELVLKPVYANNRAQTAGITRDDIATITRFSTDGVQSGVYREGDRLIPIIVRVSKESNLSLIDQVVYSSSGNRFVPIEQVIEGFKFEPQDTLIYRRNRVATITVGADVLKGVTAAEAHAQIRKTIEDMNIPTGYKMEWGGEFESAGDAQASLAAQLPISLILMVLISVLLFNALRQPLIIWLLVPMSVNGVVLGLLGTGFPFTFTALLGLLSLSGMLIKNGIVLVEEIDIVRREGTPLREAIVVASQSRVRPVVLAAATTILGMLPLLTDAFFVSMAITIMGGLAFASILTLIAAPVLYSMMFKEV